jgi:hypothetical protein
MPGQNRMAAGIAPVQFAAMDRPSALIAPSMSLSRAKKEYAKKLHYVDPGIESMTL